MNAITMKQAAFLRCSTAQMNKGWQKFQLETWTTAQDQVDDLEDCGISVSLRTVQDSRKHGILPTRDAWQLLAVFGFPLIMAVLGEHLRDTWLIYQREEDEQQRKFEERQHANHQMGQTLFGLLGSDTSDGREGVSLAD
ncbi:MAG: hypothetical protein COA43_01110 [Robiginitomaculum sp.]|nr:MAG: hypothetical protein COA43_01110 [Robiginitomaculum sp.]